MGCDQSVQNAPPSTFALTPYKKPTVFFALGGPGSNKGLYCDNLVRDFKFKYLSIKDLVAFESARDSAYSSEIKACMSKGVLISSATLTKILKKAIANYGGRAFLIDGFPRNMQNVQSFEQFMKDQLDFKAVIYFDCSKTAMESKIKSDTKNITQVNVEKIMKLYESEVLPVVQYYAQKDLLVKINTELYQNIEKNYEEVKTAMKLYNVKPCEPQRIFFMVSENGDPDRLGRVAARFFGFHLINIEFMIQKAKDAIKANETKEEQTDVISTEVKLKLVKKELDKRAYVTTFLVQGFPMNIEQLNQWRKTMDSDTIVKGLIYHSPQQPKPDDNRAISAVTQQFSKRNQLFYVDSKKPLIRQLGLVEDNLKVYNIRPLESKWKPRVFMIIGAPGSGKGAQCDKLRRQFKFQYITTAELLKKEISEKRLNAELIETFISKGKLVPGEILIRLIRRYIFEQKNRNRTPFILDGFPRNMSNMENWEDQIGDEVEIVSILHFEISEKVMFERLTNSKNAKNLTQTPETIAKRFSQYIKDTQPVIQEYRKFGLVISINAEASQDEVYSKVKQKIKSKGYKPNH